MLDKYTAYLSSPTIHLEQMKASYQLEGVCCNPLSILSLSLCPSEAEADCGNSACQHRGGFLQEIWCGPCVTGWFKERPLPWVVVAIRAAVVLYFPNVHFKPTVCLFASNKFLDLGILQI